MARANYSANWRAMKFLLKIFTWWDGATIGTHLFSLRKGVRVGTDAQGNKYFRERKTPAGKRQRRWVIYNGPNDASRVPAEWHGWLHGSFDDVPESFLPPPRIWETEFTPNPTGTPDAHVPHRDAPHKLAGGKAATYESWSPEF